MNPILKFVINHFVKLKFLDGYKMYGVGAAMLFTGLAGLAHVVATGDINTTAIEHCFTLIAGGIGVIGAAGKADGLIKATKENTAAVQIAGAQTVAATENVAQEVAAK